MAEDGDKRPILAPFPRRPEATFLCTLQGNLSIWLMTSNLFDLIGHVCCILFVVCLPLQLLLTPEPEPTLESFPPSSRQVRRYLVSVMANTDESRAQDAPDGSSDADNPMRVDSPPSRDHNTKDGPSQYEPQQPMTADASPEKQNKDTSGQEDQDGPREESASGKKSKSTKEKSSFKYRGA